MQNIATHTSSSKLKVFVLISVIGTKASRALYLDDNKHFIKISCA